MFSLKRIVIVLITISLIILIGLLASNYKKTKSNSKYQSNGNTLIESIDIYDIKDLDKYPDVKKYLQEKQFYEKLQNLITESHRRNSNNSGEKTIPKDVEAKIQKKYNLDKPVPKSSSTKITIIVQRDIDSKIAEANFTEQEVRKDSK